MPIKHVTPTRASAEIERQDGLIPGVPYAVKTAGATGVRLFRVEPTHRRDVALFTVYDGTREGKIAHVSAYSLEKLERLRDAIDALLKDAARRDESEVG